MTMNEKLFTKEEVTINSEFPISGTLTIPNQNNKPVPAVLIIAGSGKADRDGNLKKIPLNMYKDLAEFFTSLGFITLRYDKRGTYKSGGNFLEAGLSDFIDDAAACVKFLSDHPSVDKERIIIAGHSEGALIAPAVYQKIAAAGLILLAGLSEPSKQMLNYQRETAYKEMNVANGFKGWLLRTFKVAEKARQKNKKIDEKIISSDLPVMRIQGIKINAKWMRETMNYDVREYLKEVTCPVLSITGDKDVQTPPEHAEKIAESVAGDAEWHIIPNMNHIFREFHGEHSMLNLIKEYKEQIHQPIYPPLLKVIEEWLKKKQFI